jgi:GH18 family chitinase
MAVNPSQALAAEAWNAVDRIHIMSYDHDGNEHSTLNQAQTDLAKLLARHIPKEKLFLGLPFYGRKRGGNPDSLSYSQIVRRFHPAADEDSAGGFYFNGINTIQKKTRYAVDQGIGGVMIWEVGQDTNDTTSLLRAIKEIVSNK